MKGLIAISLLMLLVGCETGKSREWTMADKSLLLASTVATGADIYTTSRALEEPNVYEVNPIYGSDPSDGQIIATAVVLHAFVVIVAHYYPEVRKFLLGLKTTASGLAAWHNSTLY
jgi:hypothetical protein